MRSMPESDLIWPAERVRAALSNHPGGAYLPRSGLMIVPGNEDSVGLS